MSSASAFKQAAQAEDYAVSESKGLLQNQPDSSSVAHPPIVFGTVHSEEEAPMPELLKRPADLKEVPAAYDQWPGESIKVACPHCGVWMTTSIEAETGASTHITAQTAMTELACTTRASHVGKEWVAAPCVECTLSTSRKDILCPYKEA
ncbi:hypothetical protein HaLaN_25502 [Haematococcus lacustris]|uniref:LITAF domain-containing protein n=1 Tax=Haematococcus lacustris TaxID=44745 RepID=A0A6A0A417_HAELA|nr:hypothetical protein HaLaN_24199 [Haematococcus lacustris]GFH27214.1 hypothetical protein HaLaN_25502 [Haematococcus lacustris]